MSISSSTPRQRYSGNGVTVAFSVPFQFDLASDLLVLLRNDTTYEVTTQVKDTHYTVTGGDMATGTVTFVTAPASGYTVILVNNPAATQDESIAEGSAFPTDDVEAGLDRNLLVAQRAMDMAARSIRASDSDANDEELILPSAEERASKFLAFDAGGEPIASDGGISDAIPVSAFMETVLDDADAAAARTTLGALQSTEAMTGLTVPATGDLLPTYDVSDSAHRKITLADMLKVINELTEYTSPLPTDFIPIYDAAAGAVKKLSIPGNFCTPLKAGAFSNIGFTAATNVLTIGGATAALSSTNLAYLNLPDTSSFGRVTQLRDAAGATLTLSTGTHFGFDGRGDLTNAELWVYAVNDGSGTAKYIIGRLGGLTSIDSTFTATTNVTDEAYMLANAALEVGTWPCIPLGYVLANRNDTTNVWTFTTTVGGLNVGQKIRDQIPFTAYTATFGGLGTIAAKTTYWSRRGDAAIIYGLVTAGTVPSTEVQLGLPSGMVVATPYPGPGASIDCVVPGWWTQNSSTATTIKGGQILVTPGDNFVNIGFTDYTSSLTPQAARSSSIFTNGVILNYHAQVRVLGWSHN